MNTFRWVLGSITLLFGSGFVLLMIIGNGFRKSFGASENSLLSFLPAALAFILLFASIVCPTHRPLLHTAAIAAVGLVAYCFWLIVKEGDAPVSLALIYFTAWFSYYWLAAWRNPTLP